MKKEEIKKNVEINDNELEQVSGGEFSDTRYPSKRRCTQCGDLMSYDANERVRFYHCETCGFSIILEHIEQ